MTRRQSRGDTKTDQNGACKAPGGEVRHLTHIDAAGNALISMFFTKAPIHTPQTLILATKSS